MTDDYSNYNEHWQVDDALVSSETPPVDELTPKSLTPGSLTPKSLTPKSHSPYKSSSIKEAIEKYHKLKGAYDTKYANAKKKLTMASRGLSNSEVRRKLKNMKRKCVNCKETGGTIFTMNDRTLQAKCGHVESPCLLDLQIRKGRWMLLPEAANMSQETVDELKVSIINLKLDLLFGLRTEEEISEQFIEDKDRYTQFNNQLNTINGVIESHSEIQVDVEGGDEPRTLPISKYLKIKAGELKQLVLRFKQFITEYMDELDDPTLSEQILVQALNLYVEQIFPLMTKMRESKYAISTVHKEGDLFVVKEIKILLEDLDFEYETGEIISDIK
jgi:hypothetical protein